VNASDVMITQVVKVLENDTIRTVLEKMDAHRIGGMPVVNDRNEICGYISDGDIMRAIGRHNPLVIDSLTFVAMWTDTVPMEQKISDLLTCSVMGLATKKAITVNVETPLDTVAALLGRKHIKKVLVEKNGGCLAGLISRGDIVRYLTQRCSQRLSG